MGDETTTTEPVQQARQQAQQAEPEAAADTADMQAAGDHDAADPVATSAAGAGGEAAADNSPADDPAQAEIESLNQQLQEARDQALRAAAEMQNVRRRAERDVENAHKYGQEKLINSLLPVLDNLDRAIESIHKAEAEQAGEAPAAMKSLLEGVELTRKSALDALQGFKVEVLEPYGEPFDPQFHEAMTMVPSDTAEPNSVIDVLQKGYSLNGRLLRAAMVVIAKGN